jgi:hypothetical protein
MLNRNLLPFNTLILTQQTTPTRAQTASISSSTEPQVVIEASIQKSASIQEGTQGSAAVQEVT